METARFTIKDTFAWEGIVLNRTLPGDSIALKYVSADHALYDPVRNGEPFVTRASLNTADGWPAAMTEEDGLWYYEPGKMPVLAAFKDLIPNDFPTWLVELIDADKTELQELVDEAEELTESDYTADSWLALSLALEEAQNVLDKSNATQEEVDAATLALQVAIDALVLVSAPVPHTVIFVDWDETVLDTQQVHDGQSATAPPDPSREGYTFTGWDVDFSIVTGNLTVTALYEIIIVTPTFFSVTFVDFDGTIIDTQSVEAGLGATAPPNPFREGYTFTGWDVDFSNVTGNLTVTALYEIKPTTDMTAYNEAHAEFSSYYDTATWTFLYDLFADYTDASVMEAARIMNAGGQSHADLLDEHGKLSAGRFDETDNAEVVAEGTRILMKAITDMQAVLVKKKVPVVIVSAIPSAFVTKLNGNQNDLTITVTEHYSDGRTNTITTTIKINNNAAGTYNAGDYNVYVDTKGNDQIRECRIVN